MANIYIMGVLLPVYLFSLSSALMLLVLYMYDCTLEQPKIVLTWMAEKRQWYGVTRSTTSIPMNSNSRLKCTKWRKINCLRYALLLAILGNFFRCVCCNRPQNQPFSRTFLKIKWMLLLSLPTEENNRSWGWVVSWFYFVDVSARISLILFIWQSQLGESNGVKKGSPQNICCLLHEDIPKVVEFSNQLQF